MPADASPPDATPPVAVKKSKKLLLIAVSVVVAIALAAGAAFMFTHHGGKGAKAEPAKDAVYYALDPGIVVNFQDDSAIRFLQVGVSLMSYDPKAIDAAKAAEPRIRNALLLLFSAQKYATLVTEQGKLNLQKQALQQVQDIVQQSLGRPGINAVYFTSFVMQ